MDKLQNLNSYQADNDGNYPEEKFKDNSISVANSEISVIFRNHKQILLQKISEYNCVLGCVAWLTDPEILKALSKVDRVIIVVQKEDFLRPDLGAGPDWKARLRKSYDEIKKHYGRFAWPGLMGKLSFAIDDKILPIRCVGNHNSQKESAFPRMHNKFLIFSNFSEKGSGHYYEVTNEEVWTGSYNLTKNAVNSLENAVLIKNRKIADAYYNEFCQIFALSEPLDWTATWCEPEFRIGS